MAEVIDREVLHGDLQRHGDVAPRFFLGRMEGDELRRLLQGIVRSHPAVNGSTQPLLLSRTGAHVEASRTAAYRGEYAIPNARGPREPSRMAIWEAITAHLFELALG